jgi:hypothetical protein
MAVDYLLFLQEQIKGIIIILLSRPPAVSDRIGHGGLRGVLGGVKRAALFMWDKAKFPSISRRFEKSM